MDKFHACNACAGWGSAICRMVSEIPSDLVCGTTVRGEQSCCYLTRSVSVAMLSGEVFLSAVVVPNLLYCKVRLKDYFQWNGRNRLGMGSPLSSAI